MLIADDFDDDCEDEGEEWMDPSIEADGFGFEFD